MCFFLVIATANFKNFINRRHLNSTYLAVMPYVGFHLNCTVKRDMQLARKKNRSSTVCLSAHLCSFNR